MEKHLAVCQGELGDPRGGGGGGGGWTLRRKEIVSIDSTRPSKPPGGYRC